LIAKTKANLDLVIVKSKKLESDREIEEGKTTTKFDF
jgi:hypothetical protein